MTSRLQVVAFLTLSRYNWEQPKIFYAPLALVWRCAANKSAALQAFCRDPFPKG